MPGSDGLTADAELLCEAVREAGSLALGRQGANLKAWNKGDGSPVSEADLAVDRLLSGKLRAKRPAYGWLSEETTDNAERLSCQSIWIADPIDGTRAFIAGGSEWCVAVALVTHGAITAAAIYRPSTEAFYSAIKGRGAWRNGRAITVSSGAELAEARVIGTRKALAPLKRHGIAEAVPGALPLQLRLALVAEGHFDAAVSFGPKNDWDLAAGDLILAEAGGIACSLDGSAYVYNRPQAWQQGMAATGSARHPALIKALRNP